MPYNPGIVDQRGRLNYMGRAAMGAGIGQGIAALGTGIGDAFAEAKAIVAQESYLGEKADFLFEQLPNGGELSTEYAKAPFEKKKAILENAEFQLHNVLKEAEERRKQEIANERRRLDMEEFDAKQTRYNKDRLNYWEKTRQEPTPFDPTTQDFQFMRRGEELYKVFPDGKRELAKPSSIGVQTIQEPLEGGKWRTVHKWDTATQPYGELGQDWQPVQQAPVPAQPPPEFFDPNAAAPVPPGYGNSGLPNLAPAGPLTEPDPFGAPGPPGLPGPLPPSQAISSPIPSLLPPDVGNGGGLPIAPTPPPGSRLPEGIGIPVPEAVARAQGIPPPQFPPTTSQQMGQALKPPPPMLQARPTGQPVDLTGIDDPAMNPNLPGSTVTGADFPPRDPMGLAEFLPKPQTDSAGRELPQQSPAAPAAPSSALFPEPAPSTVQRTGAQVKGEFNDVKPEALAKTLPAPLAKHAKDFVDAGSQFGIDPVFLAAISKLETGGGTSSAFRKKNNAMGISNSRGPVKLPSVRQSIFQQARSLSKENGYYSRANSIEEIGRIYAPPGAGNDPRGTNGGWPAHVRKFYEEMAGLIATL